MYYFTMDRHPPHARGPATWSAVMCIQSPSAHILPGTHSPRCVPPTGTVYLLWTSCRTPAVGSHDSGPRERVVLRVMLAKLKHVCGSRSRVANFGHVPSGLISIWGPRMPYFWASELAACSVVWLVAPSVPGAGPAHPCQCVGGVCPNPRRVNCGPGRDRISRAAPGW